MNWSALLLLTAGLTAPQGVVGTFEFDSYTKAYHTASDAHKPMLVILNPPVTEVANREPMTLAELKADTKIAPLLDEYVVAVVDCGTEHGKQVHKVFGSQPLPYVAVIDEHQKKQIFSTSEPVTHEELSTVLDKYKEGVDKAQLATRIQAPGYCPSCVKNRQFGF